MMGGTFFRGSLRALTLLLWGLYSFVCAVAESPRQLGSNLDGVTDYSPQLPFTDLFLSSRSWFTQCQVGRDSGCSWANAWDTGEAALLDLDSNGWIRTLPASSATPIFTAVATVWALPAEVPSDRFIVLYEGQGEIEYGLGAQKIVESSRLGRDVVQFDPKLGGFLLKITSTDPQKTGNYLRSIRVVREDDEGRLSHHRFSTHFLEQLRPYQTLRFMDWMRTNNSVVSSWALRAKPTDARFSTEKGVPVEVMIELANVTGKSPWFTMPHRADNAYLQAFATLVKSSLLADLRVYVEYSNETWNSAFSQGDWIQARGESTWSSSSESGYTKRMNWHGKRSAEMCDIWRAVFADSPERVVCVLAAQAANSWTGREALSCPLWNQGPCVNHGITALAIAPYMGDYLGQQESYREVREWTSAPGALEKLFLELESGGVLSNGPVGGALAESKSWIEANKQVAQDFGVSLVAYEGGQHLVGVGEASEDEALTEFFTSANRDRRMGSLYDKYLHAWEALGGGLFVHFTDVGEYSRYGSWGALEKFGQKSSPKYDALWRYSFGASLPRTPIAPKKTLVVKKRGRGEVSSYPAGIRCGPRCRARFEARGTVTLTARPSSGYTFRGWSGACAHSKSRCNLAVRNASGVVALFARKE